MDTRGREGTMRRGAGEGGSWVEKNSRSSEFAFSPSPGPIGVHRASKTFIASGIAEL